MLFLAFSLRILAQPAAQLQSPGYKSKFGALYSDLQGSASALSMSGFHNVRLFALILALIAASGHPMFQASIYTVSATLGFAWDLALRPYEGALLSAQIMTVDVGKIAASAGYVMLAVPTVKEAMADLICRYEVVTLAVAMGGGMALVIVQIGIQVYETVRGICRTRREAGKVYVPGNTDITSQLQSQAQSETTPQSPCTKGRLDQRWPKRSRKENA